MRSFTLSSQIHWAFGVCWICQYILQIFSLPAAPRLCSPASHLILKPCLGSISIPISYLMLSLITELLSWSSVNSNFISSSVTCTNSPQQHKHNQLAQDCNLYRHATWKMFLNNAWRFCVFSGLSRALPHVKIDDDIVFVFKMTSLYSETASDLF